MNVQQLLESSNQYKSVMEDSKKLSSKWEKSGLLEGIKSTTDKNTMAMLLENQAKQLVTEQSQTGTQAGGAGAYSGESWNGVALPLVRRVFGEIAAKEFVSVQPMNLPSGLVFYLDFKYGGANGAAVQPFANNGSLYGATATANSNVTDIASSSLYGAGKFGYSSNQYTQSAIAAFTASAAVAWSDFNFDSDYSASISQYRKVQIALPSGYDVNAVRSFVFTSGSTMTAASIAQQFTTISGGSGSFMVTASALPAANIGAAGVLTGGVTLFYSVAPQDASSNPGANRQDFEDGVTKTNDRSIISV